MEHRYTAVGGCRVTDKSIAIYLPSLRGGGAERVMVTVANSFAERGYKVDLVLAKAEGPYMAEVHSSVRVVDLKSGRVLRSLPGLVRYLRHAQPTALLSALSHANVVAVVAHWLANSKARLVVSERNTLSMTLENGKSWRTRWVHHFMRLTYPRADAIVAVSNGVRDDLATVLGLSPSRIHTIYNPVVNEHLLSQSREAVAHSWFAPDEPPVILGVGRLAPQKDFQTLIHAFAQVRQTREVRLVILGEGELRRQLEALVQSLGLENDVALPGFVNNPFAYMRRAAVFVLSSRWEGLPGVLIQAMACGVPVVATDCPSGPAEILENGRWGRLVPVGDVDALAEAIIATLDDKLHPDVQRRALEFGVERAVEEYLNVLGFEE